MFKYMYVTNFDTYATGVEGMYILHKLPNIPGFSPFDIPPVEFAENSVEAIISSLNAIMSFQYTKDVSSARTWWRNWETTLCPKKDSTAMEYIKYLQDNELPYHVPLRWFFYNAKAIKKPRWVNSGSVPLVNSHSDIFDVPLIHAIAQDSVQTQFNPNPPQPRAYAAADVIMQQDVNDFNMMAKPFYDLCGSSQISTEKLKGILHRSVTYSCEIIPSSGAGGMILFLTTYCFLYYLSVVKRTLVSRIRDFVIPFIRILHRRLDYSEQNVVDMKIAPVVMRDELNQPVCQVNGNPVQKETFMEFEAGHMISERLMSAMLHLLSRRDFRVVQGYSDRYSRSPHYVAWRPSLYYNANFLRHLQDAQHLLQWPNAYRVYIAVKSPDTNIDDWALLIVDISTRSLFYLDPRRPVYDPADQVMTQKLLEYETAINRILPICGLDATVPWRCALYPHQYFEPLNNDCDSGMYVFTLMYFLSAPCPLAFKAVDIVKFRSSFAYFMLSGDIPF